MAGVGLYVASQSLAVSTLTDDFATKDTLDWTYSATADAVSGRLVLGSDDTGITSNDVYDLTDSSIYFEFPQLPKSSAGGTSALTYLTLQGVNGIDNLYFLIYHDYFLGRAQQTSFGNYVAATSLYYPNTIAGCGGRWGRIRDTGSGVIAWEFSYNGFTWQSTDVLFDSRAAGFDITKFKVIFKSTVSATVQAYGHIDNINTGSSPSAISAASLTDTFSAEDTTKWNVNVYDKTAVTGGRLSVTLDASNPAYTSARPVNLTGGAVWVEIPQLANINNSEEAAFIRLADPTAGTAYNANFRFGVYKDSSGTLRINSTDGLVNDVYNSTNHRWLRIREASGTTYYDTSPDGITWTNVNSHANPATVTSLMVFLGGYAAATRATPTLFDNFNVVGTPAGSFAGWGVPL